MDRKINRHFMDGHRQVPPQSKALKAGRCHLSRNRERRNCRHSLLAAGGGSLLAAWQWDAIVPHHIDQVGGQPWAMRCQGLGRLVERDRGGDFETVTLNHGVDKLDGGMADPQ